MSTNTAKAGLTYPALSDQPNVPSNLQTLAGQLDGIVIPKYSNASTMNSANPTPTAGDMCYRTDLKAYMSWDGAAWNQVGYSTWTTYTPTWGGLTALGSAVSNGRYQLNGKMCSVVADLEWGTSCTLGTGAITFSLPFASANLSNQLRWTSLDGRHTDGTGGVWHPLWAYVGSNSSTANLFGQRTSDLGFVTPGSASYGFAQAGAVFNISLTYETA